MPIITDRLVLRRFTYDDTQDILEFVSHPSVARIVKEIEATEVGVKKYIHKKESYKLFEKDKCFDLAIERSEDCKVIGMLTLIRKNHMQGQIGWSLGVEYRGLGYATEAAKALIEYGFSILGLHRIYADTTSENSASWRVMERLGMRKEACLKEAEFRDGKWLDFLTYGVLASEWPDKKRA
ncbi:MAG: GNAT family N-acetyltransferase [Candidatus Zixiibacteriota bacterium]|nr:MAG: GNAT family N-acetyltransferase [candidate division Zixibacteria bacterium]